MAILRFADRLVRALKDDTIPADIDTEQDLERKFVVPVATRIVAVERDVWMCSHPFKSKRCCEPDCAAAHRGHGQVVGCPKCWADSKRWASITAFGMHHTFDLVARDRLGKTLAAEIKLLAANGRRAPNGETQRFVGQCSLAATKHDVVIGICVYRGNLNPKWERDTKAVKQWCQRLGINLIFRKIEGGRASR